MEWTHDQGAECAVTEDSGKYHEVLLFAELLHDISLSKKGVCDEQKIPILPHPVPLERLKMTRPFLQCHLLADTVQVGPGKCFQTNTMD